LVVQPNIVAKSVFLDDDARDELKEHTFHTGGFSSLHLYVDFFVAGSTCVTHARTHAQHAFSPSKYPAWPLNVRRCTGVLTSQGAKMAGM
jgi:hypothetical protein